MLTATQGKLKQINRDILAFSFSTTASLIPPAVVTHIRGTILLAI